jgi:hypothetical protein
LESRDKKNNFKEISLEDGSTLHEFPTIKEVSINHFNALYSKQKEVDPNSTPTILENLPTLIYDK